VTDSSVKKAIREVVLTMAREGHAVIIGRGGVSITQDIARALHVRLVAPLFWRVDNVKKKKGMLAGKAEKYVAETDEKRTRLITEFLDRKPLNLDTLFDVTLNRSSFTVDQLSELLVEMYEAKITSPR